MTLSLFDLAAIEVCGCVLSRQRLDKLMLPVSVRETLKLRFKKYLMLKRCDTKEFNYLNIDFKNLNFNDLFMLMNHPSEVPSFAYETNIIFILKFKYRSFYENLCRECFSKLVIGTDFDIQLAEFSTNRYSVGGDKLLYSIWDEENWCDCCVVNPLFKIYEFSDYLRCDRNEVVYTLKDYCCPELCKLYISKKQNKRQ